MAVISKEFLTPLKRAGLIKGGKIVDRTFESLSFVKILDIYDEITELSSPIPSSSEMAGKLHCASISLSGGLTECASVGCRIERADELARFSALYSDHVLFYNFLSDIAPGFGHAPDEDSDDLRYRMYSDISVLNSIAPLIEQGVLIPYSTPKAYCPSCYAHKFIGENAGKRFKRARSQLSKQLFDSMVVEIDVLEEEYWALCSGEHEYFSHGSFNYRLGENSPEIENRPKIKKQLLEGNRIKASKALRKDLNLHGQLVTDMLSNASYQMAIAKMTGASFLTHSTPELSAIRSIGEDPNRRTINHAIENHWKTIVPFAEDVPIRSLLKLKLREKEAFARFRAALEKAVNAAYDEKQDFTIESARSIYSDIISPELSKLDQKVKEAKRDLIKHPLASAAGVMAALGVGLYTGMVPAELIPAAKALGLGKVAFDTASSTTKLADTKKDIRQEDFYYLWRVFHSKRKGGHG